MASTTLDLPQPLGPTTPVTPALKSICVRFAKDLKPHISSFLSCIVPSLYPVARRKGCGTGGTCHAVALRRRTPLSLAPKTTLSDATWQFLEEKVKTVQRPNTGPRSRSLA